MVKITFTCPVCEKKWIEMIDEHDVERYLPGKQFPKSSSFCCSGQLKTEYGDLELEQPCTDCLDM